MTKLNQIVAVEKGVKTRADKAITDAYHTTQKSGLFSGLSRVYTPDADDATEADQLPSEQTLVQVVAKDMIDDFSDAMIRLIDVTSTKDMANTDAKADITVDGVVLAERVPVTTLLFLEKKAENLATFIEKMPVLNPAQKWDWDGARGCYASEPVKQKRSKKVPRVLVKYEATEQHAAQTETWYEDVPVGTWETTAFSGAMKADDVNAIKERVEKLRTAIKFARESANETEVTNVEYGKNILNFVFQNDNGGGRKVSG